MNLTKNEAQTLVLALGSAIQAETHALKACVDQERRAIAVEIKESARERQRLITEFERLRLRLATGAARQKESRQ